jgi:hypothetical protein
MKITIQFYIDNDAFVSDPLGEVSEVLNQATGRFISEYNKYEQLFRQWHHVLRDSNGNRVGYVGVELDEMAPVE